MAANKNASKSGGASTPKKKSSARQHAQNRAQSQQHLAEPPPLPRSHKLIDQSRFPGETPLTGEDRPLDRPGGKQRRFEQDRKPTRGRGRTPIAPGEQALRRGSAAGRSSRTSE
jgi:hypothetical protein